MSLVSHNTLHAIQLSVDAAQHSFMLAGECIPFDEVKNFYQKFTEVYVNHIYMGKLLEVELHFHTDRKPFTACVDTRHPYDYARLYQLAYHLSEYRQQQLQHHYQQGETQHFPERVGRYTLSLKGPQLSLIDQQNEDASNPHGWMVTQAIKLQGNLLVKGSSGQKVHFNLQAFSDAEALLSFLSKVPVFEDADRQLTHNNQTFGRLSLIGLLVFTAFAVNGWFELCCLDSLWIEVPSLLAQILLPVTLMVQLVQWAWLQPSQRKQKQREAELEAQVIAGQLPQPPNPSWFKKWLWLWISLGAVGLTLGMSLWVSL
ncbi:hypothetical protein [Marinospirillum perlucidum]|uniref:hypothetical protein n=1 Tax=Marinospirillum perlucidum TaxID=1982602 RepID=UPI000DF4553F|nr:hypothetical protein [Marinospirillum perlucidum]